ncbi:MAG: hypothetical protein O7D29_04025 [Gemmatimonadetes bacterium]|nr:hypothetical protein [Gemmatimonadota bacterium]
MSTLYEILPDPDTVLELEPEELAGYLLEHLNTLPPGSGQLNSRRSPGTRHAANRRGSSSFDSRPGTFISHKELRPLQRPFSEVQNDKRA